MSKNLNISVLVAARDEYIEQLKCIITPLLIQGFNSIYADAIKISNERKTIYKFQELLKEIPQWNQTILQEESKRIKKKCAYIMDIVTAIFVSNVKILASIRLKGKNENIRVKIPTSDIFIHSIYIESAQQFFHDPFLFYHRSGFGKVQESKELIRRIIRYSVDETIRQMLPFDDILQEYLASALDDNADLPSDSESSGSESDSDEDSIHGNNIVNDSDFESESDLEPEVKKFDLNSFKPLEEPIQRPQFIPEPESGSDSESDSSSSSDSSNNRGQINNWDPGNNRGPLLQQHENNRDPLLQQHENNRGPGNNRDPLLQQHENNRDPGNNPDRGGNNPDRDSMQRENKYSFF